MAQRSDTPDGSWPITKDDKVEIQALGRDLVKFLQGKFADRDSVHIKILAGAFQYVMELQSQKAKTVGDDFVIAEKAVKQYGLAEKIEEPFTIPPELTLDEQIDSARKNLEMLENQRDVENASPAPSASPTPEPEAPVEAAPAPAPETPAAPEAPAAPAA